MATFATGRDSLNPLSAWLDNQLATTYAAQFSRYGQLPRCILSDHTTPNPNEASGIATMGPYVVLRIERDERRAMGLVDTVFDCVVRGEVKANEISGRPTSGTEKADAVLLRVLNQAIDSSARELGALGFGAITCEAQTEQTRSVRGAKQENNKPIRISFWYQRPDRG